MMSMGRYLANTVEYNEMKKMSGRWECQRNDVNISVEHSGTGRKSEKSGRWSVNIILFMGRYLENKVERRVRRGTGTGERRSQQKSGKGSRGVNIMLSTERYPENKEEHSVMSRG